MLAPGTRLGPYEITVKLGEGGMGEVWRARDLQLGREVALKVLPEAFTADPERAARFEREAKVLASLNHPNIAQIYGLEVSGDTRALVMELVEGPTLAERLEAGPLPLTESLSVALQIAQALEEAHEKGIVHRDLKPQNVKASIEGKVKVLDFGLAKAMDPTGAISGPGSASQLAASPTLTLGATQMGMILGTAAYMSPEQARGVAVDRRADIWSFGVVLFEMLAGRRLFEGELVTDVLANVLKQEVDLSALPETTPAAIRRLLRQCLERQPRARLRDIGDARLVLEEVLAGESDDPAPSASAPVPVPAPSRFRVLALLGGGVAAVAIGVVVGALGMGRSAGPEPEMRFPLALPTGWKLADADVQSLAISPDGTRRAIVAVNGEDSRGLFVGELGQVDWRLLPGTDDAQAPFFSPDGRWIGYFGRNELRRVSVDGGPPLPIAKIGNQIRGAVWTPDGSIIFSPDAAEPLWRVPESGGELQPLTTLDVARNERTHRWPDLLPDGSAVLFTSDTEETTEFYDDANIEAVVLATGQRKVVQRGSSQARYLDPGTLVYARGGALFAVPFDPRRLETRGSPVPVLQSVATNVASGAVQFAISRNGSILWIPGEATRIGSQPVWVDRQGAQTPLLSESGQFLQLTLSPDGRRVAIMLDNTATADIWVADLERGGRSRLTFEVGVNDPTWTPDGSRIAYNGPSSAGGEVEIYWKPADGSGEAELLVSGPELDYVGSFSSDGRFLAFERVKRGASQSDIWILSLQEERVERAFTSTDASEFNPSFSPDGRWLAYVSEESERPEVFVRPFPSGSGRWQISTERGIEPRWSPDGRELFYRDGSNLYRVAIDSSSGFSAGRPERIAAGFRAGDNSRTYSVAPDGKRFAALPTWTLDQGLSQVNLALHWDREVRRLLETKR